MSSSEFKGQTQQRTAKETSERKGEDSAPAGPGQTTTSSGTPENPAGHINPSAPEDSNATPGSTGQK